VDRILDDCVLLEGYEGTDGFHGESFFNASTGLSQSFGLGLNYNAQTSEMALGARSQSVALASARTTS